jgi:hypothetical protein
MLAMITESDDICKPCTCFIVDRYSIIDYNGREKSWQRKTFASMAMEEKFKAEPPKAEKYKPLKG